MVKAHSESSAMRLKSFRLVFDVFRRSWVRFPRYMLFFLVLQLNGFSCAWNQYTTYPWFYGSFRAMLGVILLAAFNF